MKQYVGRGKKSRPIRGQVVIVEPFTILTGTNNWFFHTYLGMGIGVWDAVGHVER